MHHWSVVWIWKAKMRNSELTASLNARSGLVLQKYRNRNQHQELHHHFTPSFWSSSKMAFTNLQSGGCLALCNSWGLCRHWLFNSKSKSVGQNAFLLWLDWTWQTWHVSAVRGETSLIPHFNFESNRNSNTGNVKVAHDANANPSWAISNRLTCSADRERILLLQPPQGALNSN